jgi:hypothetical protein
VKNRKIIKTSADISLMLHPDPKYGNEIGPDDKWVNLKGLIQELHEYIEKLEKTRVEEHASWAEDWAQCLAFLCMCPKCKKFLEKQGTDVAMIMGILYSPKNNGVVKS